VEKGGSYQKNREIIDGVGQEIIFLFFSMGLLYVDNKEFSYFKKLPLNLYKICIV